MLGRGVGVLENEGQGVRRLAILEDVRK